MNATPTPVNPLELEDILKDYIAKHADGFFGNGEPKDAIRIREETIKKINAHLYKEVKSLIPKKYGEGNPYPTSVNGLAYGEGYNKAVDDMEAAAQRKYGGTDV